MGRKKIIYHCYGGAHSSVTAAAIHLGKFDAEQIPTGEELLALTLFDRQTQDGHGQLHFYGFDEWENEVYSVGWRNVGVAMEVFLKEVADVLGIEDELTFIDTLHCVSNKMRVGGYISRQLGLIRIGRPFVLQGTREAYPTLVQLVRQVKAKIAQ